MKHLSLVIILLFAVLCMPLMAAVDAKLSTYTYNLQNGWNLIGIVLEPTDESEQELLAHKLYDYNGEKNVKSYQQSVEVTAGKSYWIYCDADESLFIKGTRIDSPTDEPAPQEGTRTLTIGTQDDIEIGEEVTITAPAKEGYSFVSWTVDGVSIPDTTQETITFNMPTNKVTLATNYQINSYTLTVDGVPEQVEFGSTVTKTAVEKEGYVFKGWSITGVSIEDASLATISFTMPANEVSLNPIYKSGTYMVVNLADGSHRYTETTPDLTDDTCRTTELWLRRVPKGTFIMGSPKDECGYTDNEIQHQVTLTEDFYIGIFEMTQLQYELITGERPSYFNNDDYYASRPVEKISYNMIRGSVAGAGWPYTHDVDSDSFLGKLRAKTGLTFDLPTEAQWEYACRAGTTTTFNTGKDLTSAAQDSAMDEAGRYFYNSNVYSTIQSCDLSDGTAKVGSYLPNNWGLYDMHGNAVEWCLDWCAAYDGDETDPKGPSSGTSRVIRGGGWCTFASDCRSAYRNWYSPATSSHYFGFRVVLRPSIQ